MKFKDIVVLSESPEDEALLNKAELAFDQVRATTKNIKYDDTAIDIITAVGSIVDDLNSEELKAEVEYLENAVFQAKNNLESAVYGLEEPFEDLIRTLRNKIDDEELDREYGEESVNNEASLLNPAIDAEFINWLKAKGQGAMFPYTLSDMDNPETLEKMKQMYYQETGQLAGDGGTLKHGAPGSDRRNAFREDEAIEEKATIPVKGYTDAEEFIVDFWFYGHNPSEMVSHTGPRARPTSIFIKDPKHEELDKFLDDNNMSASKLHDDELKVVLWLAKKMNISPMTVLRYGSDAIRFDTDTIKAVKQIVANSKIKKEAESPYTNSNHSKNKIKKPFGAGSHTKPKGGNPQVCHLCKGKGCKQCGDTGEEISPKRNDPKGIIPEAESNMIGTPDGYYDAEQRQEAYRDLKDALGTAENWQEDSIKDGICPECAGSGYMDGEYEDEDGNEGSECYGWGDFGCDEGEMTQRDDGLPNWAEIAKHDERQMAKANKGPAPSNEELSKLIPMLHKDYVKSGRYNAFELPKLLRQMYPEIGKHQAVEVVSDFLKNFSEGKSPHKKGTKKYKKHMAAMHAGESITAGPTKTNTRITELSPARDNSANEMKVAELLKKSIKDPKGQDAYELYAELQSENPELAELYKDVALNQYEVQLEEGFKDTLKKGAIAGGVIAMLLGINALAPTAKDGELGKALQSHVQQGGEDSDLAKYYYNALDFYADQSDQRTLINLNIKFNPDFRTNRTKYDPARQDVEDFLRKQAKLPEPTNERKLKDVGGDDIVTVNMGGVDREFIRKGDMWDSTDPKYPMKFKVGSPTHDKLLNLQRKKQMARSTPSAQAKRFGESWTPKPAGKKYWWE